MSIIGIDFRKIPDYLRLEMSNDWVIRFCRRHFLENCKVRTDGTVNRNPSVEQFLKGGGAVTEKTEFFWDSWPLTEILPCEPDQIFCRICNVRAVVVESASPDATLINHPST